MMRLIHKTQNGWLITTETGYLRPQEIAACHAFETMRSLTTHLMKLAGEAEQRARDAKEHFSSTKKKK